MKVHVVAVGKLRGPLHSAAEEYTRRCGFYWDLRVSEVADGGGGRTDGPSVQSAEAARILAATDPDSWTVALTRGGRSIGSRAFASMMDDCRTGAMREVTFWIGGAFGLTADLLGSAHRRLSLSTMTLPHDLARVLLFEQVYRAGTILRGEPYHKGQG